MPKDLDRWRRRADPLADDAVAAVMQWGCSGDSARASSRTNADPLTSVRALAREHEPACVRFVAATSSMPRFYHAPSLVAGRRVALRHAPLTFLVLLVGSLIESFAIAEGAAVLVRTGRLERDSTRRIYETATLVRALLFEGEERVGGRAHEALLRVRLLHAFVRRWVSTSHMEGRGWDEERCGVPVNQMDMIHTLLVFSHVVARGLGALGVKLSAEERASWCALWRLAGTVLGVDDALAFTDVNDESALYVRVRGHYRPDDGSRALASAVLNALAHEPPFFLPKRALEAIARRVLRASDGGDHLADAFGLARSPAWATSSAVLARAVRAADLVTRATPGAARVGVLSGWAFIELNRWRVLRTMPPADFMFRTA